MNRKSRRQELDEKAKNAREGLIRTVQHMKDDLRHTANAGAWAKRYPITTVSVAFLAGFFIDNPLLIRQSIMTASRVVKSIFPALILQMIRNEDQST